MSNQSHIPSSRSVQGTSAASIPASPSHVANTGVIPHSAFSNPYHAAYTTNPAAFAYAQQPYLQQQPLHQPLQLQQSPLSPTNSRKRRASELDDASMPSSASGMSTYSLSHQGMLPPQGSGSTGIGMSQGNLPQAQHPGMKVDTTNLGGQPQEGMTPNVKKGRTNTPWTPAEEQRLKQMRDAGNSWSEIAKTFPARTEGSVKKHWYKDMHYAEFAEDEGSFSAALLAAIKEYEASKWKVIGQKVGKPAKACEQYAKEHFNNKT